MNNEPIWTVPEDFNNTIHHSIRKSWGKRKVLKEIPKEIDIVFHQEWE